MATCPKCGVEYSLGIRDKVLRGFIAKSSGQYPVLKVHIETAKDYCNECYKTEVLPTANALIGKEEIQQT